MRLSRDGGERLVLGVPSLSDQDSGPSSELRRQVLSAGSREPAPTRQVVRRRNTLLLVSACVVPLLVFLALGSIRGGPRPVELLLRTSLGGAAVAGVAIVLGLGRGRSTLGRASVWLWVLAITAPLTLLGWKLVASAQFNDMMLRWPGRVGLRCLWLSCAMAVWPLAALVLTRRRSDPLHPGLTGAAMGSAVGASIWVLVDLNCPIAYLPHLLLGHVLPLVLITTVGAVLGRRFIGLHGQERE